MINELYLSLAILAGVAAALFVPFLIKVAQGKLKLEEFDHKHAYNAISVAVWSWLFGIGIFANYSTPDLPADLLVYLLAFIFGYGGDRFQIIALKVIAAIYEKRKQLEPTVEVLPKTPVDPVPPSE